MNLRNYIRDVLDFKPGITFFDITPLLADPSAFRYAIDAWQTATRVSEPTKPLRRVPGFLFGAHCL